MRILKLGIVELLPLFFFTIYFYFTIILFYYGPFHWPLATNDLGYFLAVIFIAIIFGYFLGCQFRAVPSNQFNWYRNLKFGMMSALILFIPASYFYTSKMPWEVFGLIKSQGIVYEQMQKILTLTDNGRSICAFIRVLISPWQYCIIPLTLLHWKKISLRYKGLFFVFLISQVIFSFLRGTDKEVGDLIIISFTTLLILFGRVYYANKLRFNFKKLVIIPCILACVSIFAFSEFTERKLARCSSLEPFCIYHHRADYNVPLLRPFNLGNKFGLSMLSLYLSEGYYGLAIALDRKNPFESTLGMGHSIFLMSLFKNKMGADFYERSYLFKIKQSKEWDDTQTWSTVIPWLASDISFTGVPFFIALIAFIWARSWKDATKTDNDCAAIVFVFLSIFFTYLPANNQIAQTADSFMSFWFWIVIWIWKFKRFNFRTRSCEAV